jgi:mannose/fructose/N-acetylgalactosamine-specific phosphotransferase system component IIC
MKSEEQINNAVENTLKVLDTIEEVKVNHFFKHKVLQQLENQKQEKIRFLSWFTPQLQLATLSVVLLFY